MVEIATITALVSLCRIAMEGGNKTIEHFKQRQLSEAEKELMIAAAKDGEFGILSVDEIPDWVRAGNKNFPDDTTNDPAIAIKYIEAFKNLCERGYISYDTGSLFRLTSAGFKKARELAT